MKLYEIDQKLEDLILQLEPDPETGEIPANEDEIIAEINALAMKREDILQYLAKLAINTRATVQSMKAEEKRLKDRRVRLEKKAERFLGIIDRECGGETTDFGVATMKYITTHPVEIENEAAALSYLGQTHPECLKVTTEISKTEVKKLIQKGWAIPGIELLDKRSGSLK